MNRQIRHLGIIFVVMFLLLFIQLNNWQVVQATKLNNDPRNGRKTVEAFSKARGFVQTSDGVIVAQSVPSGDAYNFLRQYPKGSQYAQITGFFSFNYGADGVESYYHDQLSGKTKSIEKIKDLLEDREYTENVILTLSDQLQQTSIDALGGNVGSVVAIDPRDGGILAMYSNPTYDPNLLASHDFKQVTKDRNALLKSKDRPMLPRTYRESYPPGSTFKVVTAAAAYELQPDLVDRNYPTLSALTIPGSNKPLSNFGGSACGGDLANLLRVSCNTGIGQMGLDLGADKLVEEAQRFGFNSKVPLDLPAPAVSKIRDARYYDRRLANLAYAAIGQDSDTSTTLQMALVAAGIANDGAVMTPHVMKEVRSNLGTQTMNYGAKEWKRAMSPSNANDLTENMVDVVNAGSGTGARISGVKVAGKTGTAQTDGNSLHLWFIAFAPADDPKIAVAVMLENRPVTNAQTGGGMAAPIAKQIIQKALTSEDKHAN